MPFAVYETSEEKTKMDDEYSSSLTVIDVFDIASEIGKEFEKIIDQYGPDAVTSIMPKVIVALEHLECLASKNERENTKVLELSDHIAKLEHEKLERVQDRLRFEKEVEEIEESWKEETKQLVDMVNRLQEENRKLSKRLEDNQDDGCPSTPGRSSHPLSPELDIGVLQKLRGQVDTLRDQMRNKEKELSYKTSDVENLNRQIDRLTSTVRELRRKARLGQVQVRGLIDERADFLAALQDNQREVIGLKQQLGLAEKENEDLYNSQSDSPDLTNKAVYDLDDPDRPRFTTSELKEILHDRNRLKSRVNDLEEEIERRRSIKGTAIETETAVAAGERTANENEAGKEEDSETSPVEEERPVQGPLPYEPDDAPWKKSESGIRKFFRKLFSETSTVSFLPTPATNRTPTWTSPAPSPRHRPPPVSSTELKPLHR
uniref:RILP-like protein homolog n=2 Tax=Cacopsylla melanoneura TaxID=428564 RepID=A0A8D8LXD4_9HEMI